MKSLKAIVISLALLSGVAHADISEKCQQIVGETTGIATGIDYLSQGIDPNSLPKAKVMEHAKKVDLPVVLELYLTGSDFAQKGLTKDQVVEVANKSAEKAAQGANIPPQALELLKEKTVETMLCGFDDALQGL